MVICHHFLKTRLVAKFGLYFFCTLTLPKLQAKIRGTNKQFLRYIAQTENSQTDKWENGKTERQRIVIYMDPFGVELGFKA